MARIRYLVCARRDCPELVLAGSGSYCAAHRPPAWNGRNGSTRKAASGLSGWQAQALARQVLAREPVCAYCRTARSREADHLIPLAWGASAMHGACQKCHRRKTSEEAALGRKYAGRPPSGLIAEHVEKWSRYAG